VKTSGFEQILLTSRGIIGEELKQIQIYTALDDVLGTLHLYSIELDAQLLGLKALFKENYFELANQS
jgi:N-acetylglutamate synthase/N-acetylornithine aminotransferase